MAPPPNDERTRHIGQRDDDAAAQGENAARDLEVAIERLAQGPYP